MEYSADLDFTFGHTRKVVFGPNAIANVGDIASDLGLTKLVVVTDGWLSENTDFLARLQKPLGPRLAGVYSGVIPDPTNTVVDEGAEFARSKGADGLISLGGGSAIDTAKGISVVLTEGGKILDHEGYHALPRPLVPHVAIPTTAGTGSEMTMTAVIKDPARGQKTFIGSYFLHPDVAVLDPALITGLPPELTAATAMDAMSHSVESLISSLRQPLSDAFALEAIRLIAAHLPKCLEDPQNLLHRGQTLIAAAMAGSAFSNAMVSLNHALAHTVGARFGIHHGTANAMFLPHSMRCFMDVSADRFALVARAMGIDTKGQDDNQAGMAAADRLEKFIGDIGLTKRLGDYGITQDDLPDIAGMAITDGTIIYSPKPMFEPADIVDVLKKAM
jgi:alcohol dehydrogenase class IV